jgi:hypothetical protein
MNLKQTVAEKEKEEIFSTLSNASIKKMKNWILNRRGAK